MYNPKKYTDDEITWGHKEIKFENSDLTIKGSLIHEHPATTINTLNKNDTTNRSWFKKYKSISIHVSTHLTVDRSKIKNQLVSSIQMVTEKVFPSDGGLFKKLPNDPNALVVGLSLLMGSQKNWWFKCFRSNVVYSKSYMKFESMINIKLLRYRCELNFFFTFASDKNKVILFECHLIVCIFCVLSLIFY